jgi:hypothetical protein
MVVKDVRAVENIQAYLYRLLSEKLVSVVLGSENVDKLSNETAKEIIHLWRMDQLASPEGIDLLIKAGSIVEFLEILRILNDLGLPELKEYARILRSSIVRSHGSDWRTLRYNFH